MNVNAERGRAIASQLNWLMLLGLIVPVVAVLGAGLWIARQVASVGDVASQIPVQTLLALTFVAESWTKSARRDTESVVWEICTDWSSDA